MKKRKNILLFTMIFILVFVYVNKNSNFKFTKRCSISFKIAVVIILETLNPVSVIDKPIIPGAHGFQPPRQSRNFFNPNKPGLGGLMTNSNIGKELFPAPIKPPRAPAEILTNVL